MKTVILSRAEPRVGRWIAPIMAAALLATGAQAAAADPLKVTATIKPIHALVASVMDGVGEPYLLIRGTASPHSYAMKPSDARAVNNADVFFRVSGNIEPFTNKVITTLPKSVRVVTLADAKGIKLLPVREGATFEAHVHDGDHGHGDHGHKHGHKHDHGKKKKHSHQKHAGHDHGKHDHGKHKGHKHDAHGHDDHHGDGAMDGHIWLDTQNAKVMVDHIADVLAKADPTNKAKFRENAAATKARLAALETEVAGQLKGLSEKRFIVFHDAYHYFENRFGLSAAGAITVSPEVQPSAKRIREIRKKVSDLSARCVFAEPMTRKKVINTITEGTDVKTAILDPAGQKIEPGKDAYETLIRNLATSAQSCLGGA